MPELALQPRPSWHARYQAFVDIMRQELPDDANYRPLIAHLFAHIMDNVRLDLVEWVNREPDRSMTRTVIMTFQEVLPVMFDLSSAQQLRFSHIVAIGNDRRMRLLQLVPTD